MIDRIIRAINPDHSGDLVEIGPGQGALTLPLLKRCQTLTAIELDRDLIASLQNEADKLGKLNLINQDVLTIDLDTLAADRTLRLVGNLPYNISTPLMFHLLESANCIKDMHFMVQKEVAERIVSSPGGDHYGRLSVMMQYHCETFYLFDVPPQCFKPAPKVDSAIIRLIPRQTKAYEVGNHTIFSELVRLAFQQRRKTLANGLKSLLTKADIEKAGIDPGIRAERLSGHEFGQLSIIASSLSESSG